MTAPHAGPAGLAVLVTSAYPDEQPISMFREMLPLDRFGAHRVTDDAAAADLILFVENSHYEDDPFFMRLRAHPLVQRYREKVFMYNEHDRPFCALPGVYASMPRRWFDPTRQRAGGYIKTQNPYIETLAREQTPDLLFSFSGRRTAPVRSRILDLRHPGALLWDTGSYDAYVVANQGSEPRRYAEILGRSRFVVCPRGIGTSTQRLFETMRAGRVPLILSDQWVEPHGPRWEEFSLRLPEAHVQRIPEVVEANDGRWSEMSRAARAAWEEWFGDDVKFHRIVEHCRAIAEARVRPETEAQRIPRPFPLYARNRARSLARRLAKRLGSKR